MCGCDCEGVRTDGIGVSRGVARMNMRMKVVRMQVVRMQVVRM